MHMKNIFGIEFELRHKEYFVTIFHLEFTTKYAEHEIWEKEKVKVFYLMKSLGYEEHRDILILPKIK